MKTVEAHVVQTRIVVCKKCGTRNRLSERTAHGLYRCASCKGGLPNPFWRQRWLALWRLCCVRLKAFPWGWVAAVVSVIGFSVYTNGLESSVEDAQRKRNEAVKEVDESRIFIGKLQKAQGEDQAQIKSLTTKVQKAQNEVARAETLAAQASSAQAELEIRRKAIEQELVKMGIPAEEAAAILSPAVPRASSAQKIDDALLRHLPTDNRLPTGSLLVDQLRNYGGKGTLTVENGLAEDAFVKLVMNGRLMASFYVKSREDFTYSTVPDGSYSVFYCTGYGWNERIQDFARGRHARRYDDPLNYRVKQVSDAVSVTTYTDQISLTLQTVPGGNAKASDISLAEFDQY
jgi:hypothetical protein